MKTLPCALIGAAFLIGCPSSDPSPKPEPSTQPSGARSETLNAASAVLAPASAASAAIPPPDLGPPVCTRSREKVWGSGANKLTGLTTKNLDDRVAVGFAFGVEPRVLLIEKDGNAKVLKVKLGSKAAPPNAKEGSRSLMRVSPSAIDGDMAKAFIDYRDEFKDKHRRVACGPADADENFLAFEGTSYLDMSPKPTGEEKKKLFSWKKLGGYVELRDCRTFVTRSDKETWALGSVLRGFEQPDGTNQWKMVFLVDFGSHDEEIVLHEATLKGDPPKPLTFEIPNSRRIKDKGFVITTRFGGSLMVGVLDEKRKLSGSFKTYPGFPTMPDIGRADDDMIITAGIGAGADRSLKALVIPRGTTDLPKGYVDIPLVPMDTSGDAETSFNAPELTVDSKGQRWLTYVEGPKDKGHLRIVPLGKDLKPAGRAFSVTTGEAFAAEGRMAALAKGDLMVAYLRDTAGKVELVTEELSCKVMK